jgi:hypothetical protein
MVKGIPFLTATSSSALHFREVVGLISHNMEESSSSQFCTKIQFIHHRELGLSMVIIKTCSCSLEK